MRSLTRAGGTAAALALITGCFLYPAISEASTSKPWNVGNRATVAQADLQPTAQPGCPQYEPPTGGEAVDHCSSGHPEDSRGFVLDGAPQQDDGHCVGGMDDQMRCKLARRPECRHWGQAMPVATAISCWAPEVNSYDWPHEAMMDALYCESKGKESAWTHGPYRGLFQSDSGTGDAVHDFEHAYWVKWRGQGASAWSQTYGKRC